MDNIFIERLWRSLNYATVCLYELTDGFHAEQVIGEWNDFYNIERSRYALARRTPAEAYGAEQPREYDGQGSRLAHIPTSSTATKGWDERDFGGM